MPAEAVARQAREMRQLLRYLSQGAAGIIAEGRTAETTLRRNGENARAFATALVADAVARGLILRHGRNVALDFPGRSWLKRTLAGDDGFAAQHGERRQAVMDVDGARQAVTVNAAESPLAALARLKQKDGRPFLDERAFRAGERLRADFTRGQLQPRISANWEASVAAKGARNGGIADLTDAALAARMRVERALAAVGPELSGVLIDVCCFLKGLETVERERQWPVRSGKLMLRTALSVLARHYEPPQRARQSHRWGAEGYRPELRLP